MKSFCKKTNFDKSWIRGKYYNTINPNDFESDNGVFIYVEMIFDKHILYQPLSENEYNKYFINISDIRNGKLKLILNG